MSKRRYEDFDPEDAGDVDNTRAVTKRQGKPANELNVPRNKVDKRFLKAALDAETKGVKTSRRQLDLLSSSSSSEEGFDEEDMLDGSYESSENEFEYEDRALHSDGSQKDEDEEEDLEEHVLFKAPQVSDKERGQQVLQQLERVQSMLMLRYRLQPLVLSNELNGSALPHLQALEAMLLQWLAADVGCEVALVAEQILADCRRVFTETHVAKANLTNFAAPDGWHQTNAIMQNGDVLAKHRTRLFGDGQTLTDGDVMTKLLSELQQSPTMTAMSLQAFDKRGKQHRAGVDPKASKGRKINYDVHDKLCGYMAHRRVDDVGSESWWPQSRIDDFFRSLIR